MAVTASSEYEIIASMPVERIVAGLRFRENEALDDSLEAMIHGGPEAKLRTQLQVGLVVVGKRSLGDPEIPSLNPRSEPQWFPDARRAIEDYIEADRENRQVLTTNIFNHDKHDLKRMVNLAVFGCDTTQHHYRNGREFAAAIALGVITIARPDLTTSQQ